MPASIRTLDNDGFTTLFSENWPDAFAGTNQVARKFGIESNGNRVLGASPGPALGLQILIRSVINPDNSVNDGASELRIAADTVTLSPPYTLVATLGPTADGGVWGTTGIRGYRISALNANGETIGSFEATINVDDVTKRVTLTWTTIAGATGYKVYRTAVPGTYTSPALRATLGVTGTYVDDGSATSTGTVAVANTTGGWKLTLTLSAGGAGGVWAGTGNKYYRLVAYDVTGVEIANSLEATINVDDVTKKVTIAWSAVPGVDHYKLFRSGVSGSYTAAFRVQLGSGVTSYIDDGTATTAPDLTTTPSYGIPPTLGLGPLALVNLAIGQQTFYWVNRIIGGATPEVGNPRAAIISLREV